MKCPRCPSKPKNKGDWDYHMRVVHQERPTNSYSETSMNPRERELIMKGIHSHMAKTGSRSLLIQVPLSESDLNYFRHYFTVNKTDERFQWEFKREPLAVLS